MGNKSFDGKLFYVTAYKGPRSRQNGILDVKKHLKPTNKFQYVHYSSNDPKHVRKAIVTGECHRLILQIKLQCNNISQDNQHSQPIYGNEDISKTCVQN